ncbi:MAG: cytochrome c [bacterium]|nr:cytochrome c [bacterium]
MNAPVRSTAVLFAIAWFAFGCSDTESPATPKPGPIPGQPSPPARPAEPEPEPGDPERALADRGKAVYNVNCIACHNPDPTLDGGIGPAVAGSSRELLEARIMRAEYPEGYAPKRPSQLMIALPFLEPDLAALASYLAPPPP